MNLDDAPERVRRFWRAFDPSLSQAHRFYEPFQIGLAEADSDHGARLILRGAKTATSSMLWEYEHTGRALPQSGSLSVLMDGRYQPIAIVESSRVSIVPFDRVDQPFCADYGEADGTVSGWRALTWQIYSVQCEAMGMAPSRDMPLVCEYLEVVYPSSAAERSRVADALS